VYVAGGVDGSVVPFNPFAKLVYATGDLSTPGAADVTRLPPAATLIGGVSSMSVLPDSADVIIGTSNCLMYRVNMDECSAAVLRENHMASVTQACFSPSTMELFATSSEDRSVTLWSLLDYAVLFKSTHKQAGECWCVCMSDHFVLSGWQDGQIRAHLIPTGELQWCIPNAHPGGVRCLAVSWGQSFLVSGGENGEVQIWDMERRRLISTCKEHTSRVTGLEIFDGDEACLSSSRDRTFAVWDVRRGSRLSAHSQRMGAINGIALSRDQVQVVTTGQDKRVSFWDLREPQPLQVIPDAHAGEGTCVCISPDGKLVASGGADQVVRLWEFSSGRLLTEVIGHSSSITSIQMSFDNQTIISSGADGTVVIWKLHRPELEEVAQHN